MIIKVYRHYVYEYVYTTVAVKSSWLSQWVRVRLKILKLENGKTFWIIRIKLSVFSNCYNQLYGPVSFYLELLHCFKNTNRINRQRLRTMRERVVNEEWHT